MPNVIEDFFVLLEEQHPHVPIVPIVPIIPSRLCGACRHAAVTVPVWQGVHAALGAAVVCNNQNSTRCLWGATAHMSDSRKPLFAIPPSVVNGMLHFKIKNRTALYVPCFRLCVAVEIKSPLYKLSLAPSVVQLEILHDPCHATPMHIRSRFLATQFRQNFDVHVLNKVWSAYDGPSLTWGLGQTLAMIGGGAQAAEVSQFRRFNTKMWDEDLKYNPSWGMPAAHGRKMVGSASFVPPTTKANLDKVGRHEYQVGWLALQASDFNHQSCTRRKARFPCSIPRDADAHALYQDYFSRLTHDTSALQQYMCARDAPSFRRPASLAFNARLLQLQVYNGGSHYLDWSLLKGAENLTPERFFADSNHAPVTRQMSTALRWLLEHHRRLNVTVLAVGLLTYTLFTEQPPERTTADREVSQLLELLRQEGVVVLGNSGNCRRNCSGVGWPASHRLITPVGKCSANAVGTMQTDDIDCSEARVVFVCGAMYSSSALGFFAGAVMVLVEAIKRSGFDWRAEGATMHAAVMRIVYRTGVRLKPNKRSNRCKNRRAVSMLAALEYIFGTQSTKNNA